MHLESLEKTLASFLTIALATTTLVVGVSFTDFFATSANHPVLVEGNCDSPAPGTIEVPTVPGTGGPTSGGICGDYDGDGRIGTAEDTDGADRIFGTINAALGPGFGAAGGTGANFNGRIIIVASGRFPENIPITISNAALLGNSIPGNLELEAAPGVEANIDAVMSGDIPANNNARQGSLGIVVDMPVNRRITLRNLTIRNFAEGIRVQGNSRVLIENCRIQNNLNYGVRVVNAARATLHLSSVRATGYRIGSAGTSPDVIAPAPGHGIHFQDSALGSVLQSSSTGNFGIGLSNAGTDKIYYYEYFYTDNGGGAFAGTVERREF